MEPTRIYLTASELADLLDVTPVTIRAWIRDYSLPAYQLPGPADGPRRNYRMLPREVIAWLRTQGHPVPAGLVRLSALADAAEKRADKRAETLIQRKIGGARA